MYYSIFIIFKNNKKITNSENLHVIYKNYNRYFFLIYNFHLISYFYYLIKIMEYSILIVFDYEIEINNRPLQFTN